MQTHGNNAYLFLYKDTDEYADSEMFVAVTRAKYNPAPIVKTSPNFDENANIYDDQACGFGKCVAQHYQGHNRTTLVMVTTSCSSHPPTTNSSWRGDTHE